MYPYWTAFWLKYWLILNTWHSSKKMKTSVAVVRPEGYEVCDICTAASECRSSDMAAYLCGGYKSLELHGEHLMVGIQCNGRGDRVS